MAITTYLFGAGASIGALPIGEDIPKRMKYLIRDLKHSKYALSTDAFEQFNNVSDLKSKRWYQLRMIEDLEWLLPRAKNHASIDTYAKKLKLRNDEHSISSLKRLKIALSVFFICEQAINAPDHRYDAFFASIISSLSKLPDSIRILFFNSFCQ